MSAFKKIAHRGASGKYPENTRLAFQKAVEAGADMIELDCQLTQDGHVVVFHDERLARTGRTRGAVKEQSLEQLKKLDIGSWRGKAFRGERILTLEEALDIIAGNADLCVEIKTFPDSRPGLEIKVLFILSHYDYLDRTIISSFDHRSLARVRELAPDAALGLIYGSKRDSAPLPIAARLGAASIHVQKQFASRQFLAQAWDQGLDVFVWTVNDLTEMQAFVALGVQGVISDYPERLSRLRLG